MTEQGNEVRVEVLEDSAGAKANHPEQAVYNGMSAEGVASHSWVPRIVRDKKTPAVEEALWLRKAEVAA